MHVFLGLTITGNVKIGINSQAEISMSNKLRMNAEERIKGGTAPLTRGWPTGAPALTLLHDLASMPETAGDALKLLHELQVHQVELDLQHEQAEQDLRQITEDLTDLVPISRSS